MDPIHAHVPESNKPVMESNLVFQNDKKCNILLIQNGIDIESDI